MNNTNLDYSWQLFLKTKLINDYKNNTINNTGINIFCKLNPNL